MKRLLSIVALTLYHLVFVCPFAIAQEGTSNQQASSSEETVREIQIQVPKALQILNRWHAQDAQPANRKLHIVYWTPSDREPAPRYQQRLSKLLLDIRSFYLREMQRMGFGDRTIQFDLESETSIRIHLARGRKEYASYNVSSGQEIRRECIPVLKAANIDADRETIVIFCNMSNWNESARTINQNSPYYAGGSNSSGTAWQVDSPILDLDLLDDKEPFVTDGQYGKISVGKYNSIFIGGVAHELGHALSLPHNKERNDQRRAFATALMGSGNRTYGDDRRGEGRGSFITLAHGLRLASHPMFSKSIKGIELSSNAKLEDVRIEPKGDRFEFSARVVADPPCYAVVGYMDPSGGSDYDATTCTAVPDSDGRFVLNCNALAKGKSGELRVLALQCNGAGLGDQTYAVSYEVDGSGMVDLSQAIMAMDLAPLAAAVAAGNEADASRLLKELTSRASSHPELIEVAKSLTESLSLSPTNSPAEWEGNRCPLTLAKWSDAKVGWGKPVANRLPEASPLIQVGGKIRHSGLYAHAPSIYRWQLSQKWNTLEVEVGLADGHDGSVVFVIKGDNQELWRSKKVDSIVTQSASLDVRQVNELELVVENAGDGNRADWGVWVAPVLNR